MSKYIDAEKLIAEIERLNSLVSYESKDRHDEGLHDAYKAVKNVITSLQQGGSSEDFEEYWREFEEWIDTYNTTDYPTTYTRKDIARHFAEWQRTKMMEAAIDGKIKIYNYGRKGVCISNLKELLKGFNAGDKVKVIIIKDS